jgi:putative NIF3 family GTP cyclohydrolase 1 type 2
VGKVGELERVPEVRLEMVCSRSSLALAIAVLRQFHPYEEPPIEIHALQALPQRGTGEGRRVVLDQPVGLKPLLKCIKSHLGVEQLHVAVADSAPRSFQTIGLCAGAGGGLLSMALAQSCQVFLTGEMRHHDVLAAQAAGCTVVLAGHTNTERGYLKVLGSRLTEHVPRKSIVISRRDADPLRVM